MPKKKLVIMAVSNRPNLHYSCKKKKDWVITAVETAAIFDAALTKKLTELVAYLYNNNKYNELIDLWYRVFTYTIITPH